MWNPFANMANAAGRIVTITGGQGATVFDDTGRSYLDALASLWYRNIGYGHDELADAAAAQMREIAGYQAFGLFSSRPARDTGRARGLGRRARPGQGDRPGRRRSRSRVLLRAVIGAGGVYFPPDGYLSEVQQICQEKDVLLVADEVIIGFGRTEPSRRQERAFRRSQLVRWTRVRSWLQPLTTALTPAVSSGRFPRTGRTDLVAGFIYVLAGVPIAIVVRMVDT
jgi:Aminotransferase class-III